MAQGLRIIDMECNVPYGAEHEKSAAAAAAPPAGASKPAAEGTQPAGYGMANYGRIFRSRSEGNGPRTPVRRIHINRGNSVTRSDARATIVAACCRQRP